MVADNGEGDLGRSVVFSRIACGWRARFEDGQFVDGAFDAPGALLTPSSDDDFVDQIGLFDADGAEVFKY